MKKIFTSVFVLVVLLGGQMAQADSFLTEAQMPHGEKYLPAPPDYSDLRYFNDWYSYNWGKLQRPSARGQQVVADASTSISYFCSTFTPAMGITISSSATPEIYNLLSKARSDGNTAANTIKRYYMKTRPFMKFDEPTSLPSSESSLRTNGSYPSGHTAQGWTLALILAEINPYRQDTILSRGYQYAQSRVIGGFHWQSDVDAGRCIASAAVARLHANPSFMAQLQKAKDEFARISGKVSQPALDQVGFASAEHFLPNPPDTASQRFVGDWTMYIWGKAMRKTARGTQANNDAKLAPVYLCKHFTAAFGSTLSLTATPKAYALMAKIRTSVMEAGESVRAKYMRKRPYVQFCDVTSISGSEKTEASTTSYVSAYAGIGWAVALALAEINTDRQDTLLSCGYQIGQSPIITGYHYLSDVECGRVVGMTTMARLHADPEFMTLLDEAKNEYLSINGVSQPAAAYPQDNTGIFNVQGMKVTEEDMNQHPGQIYIRQGEKVIRRK